MRARCAHVSKRTTGALPMRGRTPLWVAGLAHWSSSGGPRSCRGAPGAMLHWNRTRLGHGRSQRHCPAIFRRVATGHACTMVATFIGTPGRRTPTNGPLIHSIAHACYHILMDRPLVTATGVRGSRHLVQYAWQHLELVVHAALDRHPCCHVFDRRRHCANRPTSRHLRE